MENNKLSESIIQSGNIQKRISKFENATTTTRFNKIYCPKPFKSQNNEHKFKSAANFDSFKDSSKLKQPPNEELTPKVPPRSEDVKQVKPSLPPKPRNLSLKGKNLSFKGKNLSELKNHHQSKSFSYPNPITEDDSDDLMKRRKSCSEFQDLIQKKGEIRERILENIMLLRDDRELLVQEKKNVEHKVQQIIDKMELHAPGSEVDKVHQYLQEVDQVTKLLVTLGIRLGRTKQLVARNDLTSKEIENHKNKQTKLEDQIEEAKQLELNTKRRAESMEHSILSKYLTNEENEDFQKKVEELIEKIKELKEADNKIKSGEEKLMALNEHTTLDSLSEVIGC